MRINVLSCTSEHIYIYMVFMRVNVKQKKKIKYTCPAVVQGGCDVRHVDPSSIAR